jgi:type VI secretion system protein ImpK
MAPLTLASARLIPQFREFYAQVVRLKGEAQYQGGATVERVVWQQLVSLLERQALEAEGAGRATERHYEEAQYVMAALGDDIFVHLEWPGKEAWKSNLLEARFFGTHDAGERIFNRLDRLLQVRDPNQRELAAVYLMALALGFKGKYAVVEDDGKFAAYRGNLYSFIAGHDAAMAAPGRRLLPDLPLHARDEPAVRKLPDPRRWYYALGLSLVLFALIAHLAWHDATRELASAVATVLRLR